MNFAVRMDHLITKKWIIPKPYQLSGSNEPATASSFKSLNSPTESNDVRNSATYCEPSDSLFKRIQPNDLKQLSLSSKSITNCSTSLASCISQPWSSFQPMSSFSQSSK